MTLTEAYELVLAKVEELKSLGIGVTTSPTKSASDLKTVAKYSGPDCLPPDKWIHITFKLSTQEQRVAVFEAANLLGRQGIIFDTGGTSGLRDWELDWSFAARDREDTVWQEARQEVEELIESQDCGPN